MRLLKKYLHWYIPLLWRGGRRSLTGWLWRFCTKSRRLCYCNKRRFYFSTAPHALLKRVVLARTIHSSISFTVTIQIAKAVGIVQIRHVRMVCMIWWRKRFRLSGNGTFSTVPFIHFIYGNHTDGAKRLKWCKDNALGRAVSHPNREI